MKLTVLICTHNRVSLLEKAICSLNAAARPATWNVEILVAANACTDGTHEFLENYTKEAAGHNWLPLTWFCESTPGKSHALNSAIPRVRAALVAFVDDDHRVDRDYLISVCAAAERFPDAQMYCGRILPDWDGSEPAWVHDQGQYRIYPLPVPRYDQGQEPKAISDKQGPIPGGGNLIVRPSVFELAGFFSTSLGPTGHDLGGGEDTEYVLRAMAWGALCQYVPQILQFHYVDSDRLKLAYLLQKSFQRTRSTARLEGNGRVPLYTWRKLTEYFFHVVFALSWAKRRFYMVRTAAALGEINGHSESGNRGKPLNLPVSGAALKSRAVLFLAIACGTTAWLQAGPAARAEAFTAATVACAGTLALALKSILDFSQTGPRIRAEVLSRYRRYTLLALTRLGIWAFLLMFFLGSAGEFAMFVFGVATDQTPSKEAFALAALVGIVASTGFLLIRTLRYNPGLLVASMHYRISRFYPIWRVATPRTILYFEIGLGCLAAILVGVATWRLVQTGLSMEVAPIVLGAAFFALLPIWAKWQPESKPSGRTMPFRGEGHPNILMIGSDTLRADRLGALGYRRNTTPNIDLLATRGTLFANCYVPCARTAPSLISLLTGTWPHHHGVRDNFVADNGTRLNVLSLPQILKPLGYRSVAISDWCGADMGKYSLGFDHTDLPEDQWNLKYLLRQGPKDLRLFLSLFAQNPLGRLILPEIYYLGGVPLTTDNGVRTREMLTRLAKSEEPFFLNAFFSTTHPPFASEWPWYTKFADPSYDGESKFAMARLTDPFDIIRRQGAPKEEFDLDHIIDLYDGCVAQFDDEVGRILHHLDVCGLTENTIIVVYSDHGMEFFEHDTWGQGNSAIGDFSARTALVVCDPRTPERGLESEVIRNIDLAPTLLDLIGSVPPKTMDGVSLASRIKGTGTCPKLDAFNETGIWITDIPGLPAQHLRYPDLFELLEVPDTESGTLAIKQQYQSITVNAKDRMIRSGRWKLVFQPLVDGYLLRLYDMETDAGCLQDVAATQPTIKDQLWSQLEAWMQQDPQHPLLGRSGTKDS